MEILMEPVKVIVENIVDYTIGAVARQMGYLIHFKRNVDKLRNEVVDLEDDRKSVEVKVKAARDNEEEIEDKVQTWLKRVETITEEAHEFLKEDDQAKLKCFNGRCLNLKARYQLGKRAHKVGLEVMEIKEKGKFQTFGHRVPIQGGTTISTKGYEDFKSRKSIFDGVVKALKDDSIRAIGVYGMGGVGKTMLVGKIATQAKEDKLFERIVKVVVSQTPDLEKIQKDIAKELGLSFRDETDSQKAELLRGRLKKEKILLIIDDIWNKIDLESRGISFGDVQKGSKLLLTARSEDVLGNYTDPQEIFQVEALSKNEAEFLFVKIVGNFAKTLDFQSTMVEVVKECAGLPIAITTVANALKSRKDPKVWKDAVQQLKRANPTQIKEMHEKVYSSIKLSYDYLTKEAQSLFLFCSIFEEDKVVTIDLLWRYLVGLDFFEDVYKIEEVRNRVHTLVNSLKDSCLLLEGNGSGTFKMHDIIRDVAIYIADKDKEMLTIRSSDDLEKCSNMNKREGSFGIALFDVHYMKLPERFECPQLQFIFWVNKEVISPPIPNNVFEGMKELRVLVLIGARLPRPSSISCLDNLQSLVLDGCELEDVALIGELKNLRALTLSHSNIKQLPMEIRQLTHLQLLDLNYCTELKVIPSNVFSVLRRLEELYMNRSFNQWHVDGEITERNNTRLSELDNLPLLTTLYIHIPNPKILPKALLFEKLERYEILIGNNWNWNQKDIDHDDDEFDDYDESGDDDEFEISRTLKLELDRSLQIEDGIKVLLKSCEYLDLAPREGIKNIIYEVDEEGFPQLKHLYVRDSLETQYIVNLMEFQRVAFPVLQLLSLDNMKNLEEICHDQVPMRSFLSLKKLKVSKCEKLTFVSSLTMFGCFSQLQEIVIKDCKVMRAIFSKERKHEIQVNHDIRTDIIDFPQLRSLYLRNLPNLMGFHPDAETQLLFNEKVAFSKLEEIYIKGIDNMKTLWHNHQLIPGSFCKIKVLHVGSCKNLMNVFPPNILRRLQNLEVLKIEDCNSVEEAFEVSKKKVDEICDKGPTQLRHLTLINLPKLRHVWTSDPKGILTFQNLRQVKVSKCKTLKSLFPVSVARSLEQLESLCINDCELMEEIVALEEGLETMTKFVIPRITSLTLELLPELKCFYPEKHTSEWPSLKSLTISKCDKVKIVASNELSFTDTVVLGDHVPVQQPLFLIEKVAFSNLEEIYIKGIDNLKILWHNNQLVLDSFCKIKKLHVDQCENLMNIFPPNMSRRLWNLEDLQITNFNSVEEVFEVRGENVDEICDKGFTQLRNLTLTNLPKLKHVWTSDPEAILTFQNLRQVQVSKCKTLKSLFPVSVAKSLEQLESLRINDCELMEEIVALEEGLETMTKFVIPRITSLTLESLPELKCFYPGKHTSEWSSLKSLMISKCDKVKIVASNELSFIDTVLLGDHVPVQQPLFLIEKVAYFNLETIFINCINNLKMLWHNQLVSDSICKIKKLHVGQCENLMSIFPPNMSRRLRNLEDLQIRNCNSVEEVFEVRGENVDEICDKGSTKLRHLTLINLPKLKHVWTSNSEAILTFQNLRQVQVSKCKTLKSLFPVSVAKSLEQLESLRINDCELMEEIVALEEGLETMTKFVIPRITSLTLESLPELKCFYPGKHTSEWSSLKSLMISKCDKVKIVASNELSFTDTIVLGDHVPVQQPLFLIEKVAYFNLETIFINCINNLKMLWHNQLVSDSICKIKKLHVGQCENLMSIFPPNMSRRLRNLEDLQIRNCDSVEEVFEVRGENVDEICDKGSTKLRQLTLINLPKLKHVWTSNLEAILTFQNLRQVQVSKCKTLKSLFPVSVAKSLEQLESLRINDCELMEEIVALEEGLETMTKFVIPRITSLTLESLPVLKCFYLGKHTSEWPSLKSLTISKCDKVKIVALNELSFTDTVVLGDHDPVQQPLFLIEKDTFPNLKELKLDWNETMNQTDGRLFGEFFSKLEVLSLYGKDYKLIAVPSVFVEGLRYLKSLSVSNLFFDNKGQYTGMFERLTRLNLSKMPKLMLLWKENFEEGRALQNLENLRVLECSRLKNLVPSSMYFQNLNTLSVSKCHGLINLATSSTVKSLVQLKKLDLSECKRMREIVTNEGEGEAGEEICFNQLQYVYLHDLPSLRSFHLGNRAIKFPSLEYLYVTRCPELKIFSNGVISMPKLEKVGLDENRRFPLRRELLPEEDVNSVIKRYCEENYDTCVQQLFIEKENGVDDLEDDSKED